MNITHMTRTEARNVVEMDVTFTALICVGKAETFCKNKTICCWLFSSNSAKEILLSTGAADAAYIKNYI